MEHEMNLPLTITNSFFEIEQVRDSAAFLRHSLEDLGKYERMSLKSAKIATKWEVLRSINVALFFFQFWF